MNLNLSNTSFKDVFSDYKSHKQKTLELSEMCRYIEDTYSFDYGNFLESSPEYWQNKCELLKGCGSFLDFAFDPEDLDYTKLINANFCKYRLCPACAWRKSLKTYSSTRRIVDFLRNDSLLEKYGFNVCKYQFLFGTFTIKNVTAENLEDAIDTLLFGFTHRFMRRKEVKKAFCGCIRTLEVTFNSVTNTFHPHIHAIFCIDDKYFTENYLDHDTISNFAKSAFKCDSYTPITHIEKIKDEDNLEHAIAETSKYCVKGDDYISNINFDDFDNKIYSFRVLDKVLSRRRLVSYSGILKKIRNLLRDDDIVSNDDDLVEIDGQKLDTSRELFVLSSRYDIYMSNYRDVCIMSYDDWKVQHEINLSEIKICNTIDKIESYFICCKFEKADSLLDDLAEINFDLARKISIKYYGYSKLRGGGGGSSSGVAISS